MTKRKVLHYSFEVNGYIEPTHEPSSGEDSSYGERSISSVLHAFCDDGTIWYLTDKWELWKLPSVPGTEEKE